ncbi:MAG: OmpA family protein [Deltaproteobacteria bacterium]|nr:OmpA family protein [Deltaproteobacteria bacterium]
MGTRRAVIIATFGLGLFAACSGSGQASIKVATPKPAPKKSAPRPAEPEEATVPVTESVAISMDIAEACEIQADKQVHINPHFNYDRQELAPEDRRILEVIAKCLTDGGLKGRQINLIGRADPRGTDEYNLALGSKRARAVYGYLEKTGVKDDQLNETTRGSLDATGTSERGWRNDRRVDIVLFAPKNASL